MSIGPYPSPDAEALVDRVIESADFQTALQRVAAGEMTRDELWTHLETEFSVAHQAMTSADEIRARQGDDSRDCGRCQGC